jgi:hypothetical protein
MLLDRRIFWRGGTLETQNASSAPLKTGKGRADAQAGAHTRQPSRRTREMAL